jgi:hypothetical protein
LSHHVAVSGNCPQDSNERRFSFDNCGGRSRILRCTMRNKGKHEVQNLVDDEESFATSCSPKPDKTLPKMEDAKPLLSLFNAASPAH